MRFFLGCLAALVFLTACGGGQKSSTASSQDSSSTSSQNGSSTVTTNDKTTTVQTKGSQVTVGAGALDQSKLGAPIYPGAKQVNGQSAATVNTGSGSSSGAVLTTNDPFSKVADWYKSHMPAGSEKGQFSQGGSQTADFVSGAGSADQTSVVVMAKGAQTQITIAHVKRSM